MNLLKMMENNDVFSQSELIIRNFVLNEKENIANFTVNEIASLNYVSKSTLVRFAQKLGFNGWNDFKLSFLKELYIEIKQIGDVDFNFPFTAKDSPVFIANKLCAMKKNNIEDTLQSIDIADLQVAAHMLAKQDRLHIFGEGYSLLASEDFCYRMTRMGKLVSCTNDMGMSYIAKTLTKNDLGIIISYSGRTKNVVKAATILKSQKVPIISLSASETNPISELSDICLHLPSNEDLYSKISNFATVDSIRFIFDILFSVYFNKNFNSNLDDRVSMARVVDKKE